MNFTRRLLSISHKYPISPSTQRVSSPILVYFSYCLALCSFRRITAPVPPASSTGQDVVTFVANIELFMYIHWKRGGSKINIDVLEETPPVAFGILRMDRPRFKHSVPYTFISFYLWMYPTSSCNYDRICALSMVGGPWECELSRIIVSLE